MIHMFLELIDPPINFLSYGLSILGSLFIFFFAGKYYNQSFSSIGRDLITGFIITGIVVQILKHMICRARPRISDYTIFIGPSLKGGFDSFPSGHTAIVFCLAYILSQQFPKYQILFYFVAFLVGFEREEDLAVMERGYPYTSGIFFYFWDHFGCDWGNNGGFSFYKI